MIRQIQETIRDTGISIEELFVTFEIDERKGL